MTTSCYWLLLFEAPEAPRTSETAQEAISSTAQLRKKAEMRSLAHWTGYRKDVARREEMKHNNSRWTGSIPKIPGMGSDKIAVKFLAFKLLSINFNLLVISDAFQRFVTSTYFDSWPMQFHGSSRLPRLHRLHGLSLQGSNLWLPHLTPLLQCWNGGADERNAISWTHGDDNDCKRKS